jgi:hypothetical protein
MSLQMQVKDFSLFAGVDGRKAAGGNSRPLQPLNGRVLEYGCLSTS